MADAQLLKLSGGSRTADRDQMSKGRMTEDSYPVLVRAVDRPSPVTIARKVEV